MPVAMDHEPSENSEMEPSKGFSKHYGGGGGGFRGRYKPGGRRSFLQKAKRFGKQGRVGHGFQVDEETFLYFVRIFELLKNDDFESEEDRDSFVENSLSLAEGSEVDFSSNQLISRVIENILPFASEDRIHMICEAFTPSLRVIVSDPFASHVLEKLLEITSSDKWRSSEKLTTWFEKTSMFILNNFEDFTFEAHSSFVMKKVMECLAGNVQHSKMETAGLLNKSAREKQLELYGVRTPNASWEKTLQDFGKRFAAWPQLNDLGQKPLTARLVQNVMESVHKTRNPEEIVKELALRVLGTLPEKLEPKDFAHRTLEVCLSVADEKLYGIIYNKFYKGQLMEYCTGSCFTLQKVISTVSSEKYFVSIFEELSPSLEFLLRNGKTAVIQALVIQSSKHQVKQKELYDALEEAAVAIHGQQQNLVMTLVTSESHGEKEREENDEDEDQGSHSHHHGRPSRFSSYFGVCTVEALMDFKDPKKILDSICQLDNFLLKKLALDPKASFIISKFFKSWNVPQKHKLQLLDKLKDFLVEFGITKFGSRILDVIWLWAGIQQKTTVAEVLSERIPLLSANKYGRFLVENMGLNAFKRNKKEWVEHMLSEDKRKREAKDIAAELGIKETDSPARSEVEEVDVSGKKKGKKRKSDQIDQINQSQASENETDAKLSKKKKKNKKNKSQVESELELTLVSEPEESKTPKKKNRKSGVNQETPAADADTSLGQGETPSKKKNKKRKSEVVGESQELSETPKKKKKNRNSGTGEENDLIADVVENVETPKKKDKKKNRKSEISLLDEESVSAETTTPNKKKNKGRKSKQF